MAIRGSMLAAVQERGAFSTHISSELHGNFTLGARSTGRTSKDHGSLRAYFMCLKFNQCLMYIFQLVAIKRRFEIIGIFEEDLKSSLSAISKPVFAMKQFFKFV